MVPIVDRSIEITIHRPTDRKASTAGSFAGKGGKGTDSSATHRPMGSLEGFSVTSLSRTVLLRSVTRPVTSVTHSRAVMRANCSECGESHRGNNKRSWSLTFHPRDGQRIRKNPRIRGIREKRAAGCVGFPFSSGDGQVWTAKSAQMTSLASNSLCASDTILRESLAELTL